MGRSPAPKAVLIRSALSSAVRAKERRAARATASRHATAGRAPSFFYGIAQGAVLVHRARMSDRARTLFVAEVKRLLYDVPPLHAISAALCL